MELLLIRHGLPVRVENEDGTPADPPLAPVGAMQARALAEWLEGEHVDRIYSSPLRRARETAAPFAELRGLPVDLEPGIAEFDGDSPFYVPLEELKEQDYERWKAFVDGGYGTELDFASFHELVVKSVERIIEANRGRRVAVFCHGGVINCWAAHVLGLGPRLFMAADYTSINRFMAASTGERSLPSLNEAAHLRGL